MILSINYSSIKQVSYSTIIFVVIASLLVDYIDCRRNYNFKNEEISTVCSIGSCQTPFVCFSVLVNSERVEACKLNDGSRGICCPNNITEAQTDKKRKFSPNANKIEVTLEDLGDAWNVGNKWVDDVDKIETKLKKNRVIILPGSTESIHQSFFGNNPLAVKLGRDGIIALQATLSIAKQKKLSASQARYGFGNIDLSNTAFQNLCQKEPSCQRSKYRTPDGTCNNLNNKSWGKSMSAFNRMLLPDYSDGVNEPRVGMDGKALPGAREVSLMLAPDINDQHRKYTLLVMQFGQFLDHDLDRTASTRTNDNSAIQCCPIDDTKLKHPACMPIKLPEDDPFFSKHKQTCMNFVRSAAAPKEQCKLGHREQLNQISSYIDGGPIYGPNAEDASSLRLFKGGKLRTSQVNNREFLPFANKSTCSIPDASQMKCFAAGDGRINEQVDLVVMHALWLREHNRIAEQLSRLNPGWNDEILYQETRRIVVAELQHVAYNEFLPVLIGHRAMGFSGALLRNEGYSHSYSPQINAAITSVFATAAYRFHTLVPGFYDMHNQDNKIVDILELSKNFDNPQILYKSGTFDTFVTGLTAQPVQRGDSFFSSAITQHLFQPEGKAFGMDLISLNIQRGRDHGLPGYNAWRQECGFGRFRNFRELESVMHPNVVQNISRVYRHVDDIDLFIGGFAENNIWGTLVGPTFACLLGEQFRRIKNGDRFWYENGGLDTSFTYDQLTEIRKVSLARIICDNSDNIQTMQFDAMVQSSHWNYKVLCKNNRYDRYYINRVNLKYWQNEQIWS